MKCKFVTSFMAVAFVALVGNALGQGTLTYSNIIQVINGQGITSDLAPIVRIVSPLADALVAPGEARVGAGNTNGSAFALNVEVVTRDSTPVTLNESTLAPPVFGIRHVNLLGSSNPDFPGFYVFFDTDLITPTGGIIPALTNLGNLFNVAGTDDTPGGGVTLWTGWHVLESLPPEIDVFNITVAVVDKAGRIGTDRIRLLVDRSKISGQALTP